MPAHLRFVIGIIGLALALGCNRNAATPSAKLSTAGAGTQAEAEKPPEQAPETAAARAEASPTEEPAAPDPDASLAAEAETSDANAAHRPERILILTPGGPLVADVMLTIDGQPHTQVFDKLLKTVLDAGDTDGDQRPTWNELLANRTYPAQQQPNAPAAGSRQMKNLIERYDENRDGEIQPGEAASWLGRDAGRSAAAFQLRSSRSYRPTPRAASQVWHFIDANNDGRLSSEEIQTAPQKLLSLDADDDRVIAPPEMASLRELLEAAGGQRVQLGRQASHYAAIHLELGLGVDRLYYLLSDLYAPRQDLGPSSFSQLASLFRTLDATGDEWLERDELAALFSIEPQLKLSVSFQESANAGPAAAAVEVHEHAPEIEVIAQPAADRAVLALGSTRLIISAHNLVSSPTPQPNAGQSAARAQVRLMVHDQRDALFEELDANADGRLGEREIAFSAQRLAERDRNGDGLLSGEELPYAVIVAFLMGESPTQQSFYVPMTVATATGHVKPAAWFAHADLNGDGDVSRREFLGASEQFNRLDSDSDGYISAAEAVASPQ